MHILLIHQAFAALDEPGGTRHHELARYLARRGHLVTVIASPVSYLTGATLDVRVPWVKSQPGGEGVNILRAYTYPALHRSFVHRVFSFFSFMISSFLIGIKVKNVDLVWGTSPPIFQGVTAWAIARLRRVPFLFEVRDLWPAFAVAVGVLRQPHLIKASEWLEGFLYRRAGQVIVNSPGYIEHVEQRGARRIALIPNGADTGMYDPSADGIAFRRAHGLEGKFVVMYTGAHGMSNDLEVVLEAAYTLRAYNDIMFVLVGDGKEKPKLVERAREMGLSNLIFLTPVAKREMPAVLTGAHACIAILKPVEWYKTVYPNKVFDYMAAGRAVILAIDGVIREVVECAGGGVFVPPGDPEALAAAVKNLAANPSLCVEMGKGGRQYVEEHFNRAELAEQLAKHLESLVD